jgi:polyisoprenoid-binding protein YceI
MSLFRSTLILALALSGLVACGDAPPAAEPAQEATPEATPAPPTHSVALDAASTVSWTSIKNGDAPVKGTFTKVSGGLSLTAADLGATTGEFKIDLSGIASGVELRDLRISEAFFGSAADAPTTATVTLTKLSPATATIEPGGSTEATADLTLVFAQGSVDVQAKVTVSRSDENTWTVATVEDVKLSIKALGLNETLAALIKLCGHTSVDDGVAIALDLTFKAAP